MESHLSTVHSQDDGDNSTSIRKPQAFKPMVNWNAGATRAIRTNLRGSRTTSNLQSTPTTSKDGQQDQLHSSLPSALPISENPPSSAQSLDSIGQPATANSLDAKNALLESPQIPLSPEIAESEPQSMAQPNPLGRSSQLSTFEPNTAMSSAQQAKGSDIDQDIQDFRADKPRGESWSGLIRKAWSGLGRSGRSEHVGDSAPTQRDEPGFNGGSGNNESQLETSPRATEPFDDVVMQDSDDDLLRKQLGQEDSRMEAFRAELNLQQQIRDEAGAPSTDATKASTNEGAFIEYPQGHTGSCDAQSEVLESDEDNDNVVLNLVQDEQDAGPDVHDSALISDDDESMLVQQDSEPALLKKSSRNELGDRQESRGRRLFVDNLPLLTTEADLEGLFKSFSVESVTLDKDVKGNRNPGSGYVHVATTDEAERAVTELDGKILLNRILSIQITRGVDTNVSCEAHPLFQVLSPNSQLNDADDEDENTVLPLRTPVSSRSKPPSNLEINSKGIAASKGKEPDNIIILSDDEEPEAQDGPKDNDLSMDSSEEDGARGSGNQSEEEAGKSSDREAEEGEIPDSESEQDAMATEYSNANQEPRIVEPKTTKHQVEIIDLCMEDDEPQSPKPEVTLGQGPKTLVELTPAQLEIQVRYFYVARDPKTIPETDPVHCTICAKPGHLDKYCPSRVCINCKTWDSHFVDSCPERARCSRCRGAHKLADCNLKLKPDHLVLVCDLCNEKGHDEDDCELRWRSSGRIWEKPLPPLSVARYCYECGTGGHLGNDCPSRRPGKPMGSSMWSEKGLPYPMPSLKAMPGAPMPRPKKQPNNQKGPGGGQAQFSGQAGMKIKGLASSTNNNPNKRRRLPSPDSPVYTSDNDSGDIRQFFSGDRSKQSMNRHVPAPPPGPKRANRAHAPAAPVMRFPTMHLPPSQVAANAAADKAAKDRGRHPPPPPPRDPYSYRERDYGYERNRGRDMDRDYYDRDRERSPQYNGPTGGGRFRDFRDERDERRGSGGGARGGRNRRSRSPPPLYDHYKPSDRRW